MVPRRVEYQEYEGPPMGNGRFKFFSNKLILIVIEQMEGPIKTFAGEPPSYLHRVHMTTEEYIDVHTPGAYID